MLVSCAPIYNVFNPVSVWPSCLVTSVQRPHYQKPTIWCFYCYCLTHLSKHLQFSLSILAADIFWLHFCVKFLVCCLFRPSYVHDLSVALRLNASIYQQTYLCFTCIQSISNVLVFNADSYIFGRSIYFPESMECR